MVDFEGIFIVAVYLGCIFVLNRMFSQSELDSRNVKNRVPYPIPFSIIVAQGTSFILANTALLVACLILGRRVALYEVGVMKLSLLAALAIEPLIYQKLARRGPNVFKNTACNKFFNAGIAFLLKEYILMFVMCAAGVCTLFCAVSQVKDEKPTKSKPLANDEAVKAAVYTFLAQAAAIGSKFVQHDRAVLNLFADNLALWGPLIATSLYVPVYRKWTSLAFAGLCSLPFTLYTLFNAQQTRDAYFLAYTRVMASTAAGLLGGLWKLYATDPRLDYFN